MRKMLFAVSTHEVTDELDALSMIRLGEIVAFANMDKCRIKLSTLSDKKELDRSCQYMSGRNTESDEKDIVKRLLNGRADFGEFEIKLEVFLGLQVYDK